MYKPDLSEAFIESRQVETEFGLLTLNCHTIGELVVLSGEIVACDPLVFYSDADAFTLRIKPGSYPVVLSIASFHENGDQRVAYAKLQLSEKASVKWEMALIEGQDVSKLKDDEMFGYPVDSGTGCFLDKTTATILADQLEEDDDFDQYLIDEMEKHYVDTWDWGNFCLDPATGSNLITFKSGLGDGVYASFWGYDENGDVTCLVTDFGVL